MIKEPTEKWWQHKQLLRLLPSPFQAWEHKATSRSPHDEHGSSINCALIPLSGDIRQPFAIPVEKKRAVNHEIFLLLCCSTSLHEVIRLELCDSVRSDKSWPRTDVLAPTKKTHMKTHFWSVRFTLPRVPVSAESVKMIRSPFECLHYRCQSAWSRVVLLVTWFIRWGGSG